MAHPCFECGAPCHCHCDFSDSIDSQTPDNCYSCGCEEMFEDDDFVTAEDFDDDDDADYPYPYDDLNRIDLDEEQDAFNVEAGYQE